MCIKKTDCSSVYKLQFGHPPSSSRRRLMYIVPMYTCVITRVCCTCFAGLAGFLDGRQATATGGRAVCWWKRRGRTPVLRVLRVRRRRPVATAGRSARDRTDHPTTRHHVRGPAQGSQPSRLVRLVDGSRIFRYVYTKR